MAWCGFVRISIRRQFCLPVRCRWDARLTNPREMLPTERKQTMELRPEKSHQPPFFLETSGAQKQFCRLLCEIRRNPRSCPCPSWPRAWEQNRAPDRYGETKQDPVSL